jgi:Fusaric acid resistance protein-like
VDRLIGWLRLEPDPVALKGAARAAIVIPAVFAFADLVIRNPDTTLLAAFGSFAILVQADFGGPPRARLAAYVSLAVVGAVLIALGTLCSQTPWLAVAGTGLLGFAVLFSGVVSGYFAAAGFATLLLFIIPVAVPGPVSAIPARLEGWALAASVGTCARMLIWPGRPPDVLRGTPDWRALLEQAGPASPLFRHSIRGAAGLTAAVLVIQLASVQHAFWVALATLSVLRSDALGTRTSVLWALVGTTVGIAIGGVLIYAIGTSEEVLWAVLPPAILVAAYAPLAISFAAGQAGFTVLVLIILNIIDPTGWTLGLVRVEDVGIGCAISLAVGVLFWPRGGNSSAEVGHSLPSVSGSSSPGLGPAGMANRAVLGDSSTMVSTPSSRPEPEPLLPPLPPREATQAPGRGRPIPRPRPGLASLRRPSE